MTQTTPKGFAPRVTLDVQGVGKAEIKAFRLKDAPEQVFIIDLRTLILGGGLAQTVFLVPNDLPAPGAAALGSNS